MKLYKILLSLLLCISIAGCSKNDDDNADSEEISQYTEILNKLESCKDFAKKSDNYNVEIVTNIVNDETRYDIVINDPKVEMKEIKALCYVEEDEDSTVPSLGILESESFYMKPDYVNKKENYYKGINLSGTTDLTSFHVDVYVNYNVDNQSQEDYLRLTAK